MSNEMNNKIPKMRVKLGELNELKFKLSIKGSTSDPDAIEPKIRFLITEKQTGMSVCLPMEMNEGLVKVTLPNLPGVFRENSEYTGNVEVIVGSRYFNPTTVGLVFEREMEVEAAPIFSEESRQLSVEELQEKKPQYESEDELSSVIKPNPTKSVKGFDETMMKSVIFTEKQVQKPVIAIPKKPIVVNATMQKTKNYLKAMIAEAWEELEE